MVDGFGEVIQEVSPDRGTRSYWYDAAGHVTKWIDGDGEETDFTYDLLGRRKTMTFPEASVENVAYTYDATASGNDGVGRLTSVTDQSGSASFTYDALGRVTKEVKVIQGKSFTIAYAYDANGKVTQETLPSGRIVTIARATDGLVTGVTTKASSTAAAQAVASNVAYVPFGPLTSLTYGNGLALTRTYGQNYWLLGVSVTGASSATLNLSLTRDNAGSLTNITDNAATGRGAGFGYTPSGRLQYAVGPWGEYDYGYDGSGNMIERDTVLGGTKTYAFPATGAGTNQIAAVLDVNGNATRTLGYRAGGDLYQDARSGGATYSYSYNARKRPVQIQLNGTTAGLYGYDAFGHRVWRSVSGMPQVQTEYVYDLSGQLLAEYNAATGAVSKEYVWIDDMPVAVIDSSSGKALTYYIHTGPVNEPLVMTNAAKSVVWNAYMEPFGAATVFGASSAALDLRLPGQWLEAETGGLNQNWFRDYDPTLGRYIEADPLGLNAGQNVYAYVDGKPGDWDDPEGLQAYSGQTPPSNIPGGPWSPAGSGQPPGTFYGPASPKGGPRAQCRYVPDGQNGGPRGAPRAYWKAKIPNGWQRYNQVGDPITEAEAHPGDSPDGSVQEAPTPAQIVASSVGGGPIIAAVTAFIVGVFYPSPAH